MYHLASLSPLRVVCISLALLHLAIVLAPARSQAREADPDETPSSYDVLPPDKLYPIYRADQHRPGFGVMLLSVPRASAPDSSDRRVALKTGGRFGLVRFEKPDSNLRFQLNIEAGFYGQFDIAHSLDNLGWDGIYGLLLTSNDGGNWAFKAGAMHFSSHIGDEYAERTGRLRIGYTREEWIVATHYAATPRFSVYAEGGWGYILRYRQMEPARLQVGAEYESPRRLFGGTTGWYAAANVNVFEERQWNPDVTAQLGLLIPSGDREWRVGVSGYRGRIPIGEFFLREETYVLVGLWLDV